MKNKYILVRHGQDEDNLNGVLNGHRNNPLTDLGKEQALQAAKKLEGEEIDIVLASPLQRAQQTAYIIAETLDLGPVKTQDLLIERDFGKLTGEKIADIPKLADKLFPTDKVNYFLEYEGAEDFPTLLNRAKALLEVLEDQYEEKTIMLVTHGDIGKMIRAAYKDWTWEEGLKTPYFANTEAIALDA